MLAMLLGALAPTLAHAWVAAADEGRWIEVCSTTGVVWLKADSSGTSADAAGNPDMPMADRAQHCPWCSVHGAMDGVLPNVSTAVASVRSIESLPVWLGRYGPVLTMPGVLARAPPIAA